MPQVLSQDEVDALLKGLNEGKIGSEKGSSSGEGSYQSYDFTNQDIIVRGRMPALEAIHERFSRLFRTAMSSMLKRVVTVSVVSSEMLKFGDYLKSVALPASFSIIKIDPLRGFGIVSLDSDFVMIVVDIYFGGKGQLQSKIEERDFTSIEMKIVEKVVGLAIEDYQKAWAPVFELKCTSMRSEVNPQFVTVIPQNDMVLIEILEIDFGTTKGTLTFCIPYSMLEPIRDKLKAVIQSDITEVDPSVLEKIKVHLNEITLNLSVTLGSANISAKELLNLKIGDIIQLDQDYKRAITAYVEGQPKMKVYPGNYNGSRAVKIESIIRKGV